MKKLIFLLCLFSWAKLGVSQVTVQDDPRKQFAEDLSSRVEFAAIHFSIQPPLHFVQPDTGFIGFMHPGAGASIAIIPIPYRSYENVGDEFAANDFAKSNSKLINTERIQIATGHGAYLYTVHFVIQDQLVERLVLILGTEKKTYMVYANYPAPLSPVLNPVIKSSFNTIQFEE